MDLKIKNKVNILLVIIIAIFLSWACVGCAKVREDSSFNMGAKVVGKTITEDKFREFYYTYSTTVNPPEFQRYRFFKENGKVFFYHEKREGNNTFLTEENITESGTKELSNEEWATFWDLIDGEV